MVAVHQFRVGMELRQLLLRREFPEAFIEDGPAFWSARRRRPPVPARPPPSEPGLGADGPTGAVADLWRRPPAERRATQRALHTRNLRITHQRQ